MELFIHASVIGLLSVILASVVKKSNQELALLLTLAACVLIGIFLLRIAEPVVDFLAELRNLSGLDKSLMTPMLKTVGIGLLTQICSNVCADAGQSAVAKLVELCGGVLAIYIALPLLEAVIDMMRQVG